MLRLLPGFLVVVLLASALALLAPGLLSGLRGAGGSLGWNPECVVETPDGKVGISREEAQRATTAVALLARGLEPPDTSGIDAAALQQLAAGPPGDAGPSLGCRASAAAGLVEQQPGDTGLTPRAEQMSGAMTEVFGTQSLGGFAPGGVGQGHGAESTHYDGRAVDVFFRPVTEENRRAGWILAHWLVAHADGLDIQYVIFDDRFWSVHSSRGLCRSTAPPSPATRSCAISTTSMWMCSPEGPDHGRERDGTSLDSYHRPGAA